jgi:hypothetical protein
MGMDVVGVNPKNSKGEYFRANCWMWRPLCVAMANSGAADHLSYKEWDLMAENSGGGPRSKETCEKMAEAMEEWYDWNEMATSEDKYHPEELDEIDMFIEKEPNEHGGHRFVNPDEEPEVDCVSAYGIEWKDIKEWITFLKNCGDGFEVW